MCLKESPWRSAGMIVATAAALAVLLAAGTSQPHAETIVGGDAGGTFSVSLAGTAQYQIPLLASSRG
jgi:hypothetical protein